MAVELRYHVIREGKEVAVYTTKKEADEHDKMLDIAQRLADFIQAAQAVSLDEQALEELCIYLSKNRLAAIGILKGGGPGVAENKGVDAGSDEVSEKPRKGTRGKSAQKSD
jgi:dsDNA-binding SOS-regulon protein